MAEAPAGLWCSACQGRVDSADGTCPDCSGPIMTMAHGSECRGRELPLDGTTAAAADPAPSFPRSRAQRQPVDPLLRRCARCHEVRLHKPRPGTTDRPRSYCRECDKAYYAEYRKREWAKEKARNTWKGMIGRCHEVGHGKNCPPGIPRYSDYGARGVRVAKRWRDPVKGFENFLKDMGLPPNPKATLDRRNPKRNYTPSNCRWVDKETQDNNRRTTHWLTATDPTTGEEVTDSIAGWARRTGLNRRCISHRLQRGWCPEDAVGYGVIPRGQTLSIVKGEGDEPVPF